MEDKDAVVGRLEGKEMKTFRIEVSNKLRVLVDAFDEKGAEEEFNKKVDEDYDFPWREAEDYDGWTIESIDEV